MRPPWNQSRGTMVSSGWYQLRRAFLRSLGGSAMKVDRNLVLLAALQAGRGRQGQARRAGGKGGCVRGGLLIVVECVWGRWKRRGKRACAKGACRSRAAAQPLPGPLSPAPSSSLLSSACSPAGEGQHVGHQRHHDLSLLCCPAGGDLVGALCLAGCLHHRHDLGAHALGKGAEGQALQGRGGKRGGGGAGKHMHIAIRGGSAGIGMRCGWRALRGHMVPRMHMAATGLGCCFPLCWLLACGGRTSKGSYTPVAPSCCSCAVRGWLYCGRSLAFLVGMLR